MAVTLAPLTDYPFDTVTRRTDEQQFGVEILMLYELFLQPWNIRHMVKVNAQQV